MNHLEQLGNDAPHHAGAFGRCTSSLVLVSAPVIVWHDKRYSYDLTIHTQKSSVVPRWIMFGRSRWITPVVEYIRCLVRVSDSRTEVLMRMVSGERWIFRPHSVTTFEVSANTNRSSASPDEEAGIRFMIHEYGAPWRQLSSPMTCLRGHFSAVVEFARSSGLRITDLKQDEM